MTDDFDPYYDWLGIRPHEHPVDHYRLLGLPQLESDPTRINAAADQRLTYLRSLQSGPRGVLTQQLLNEVSAARKCLLDQQEKARYDATLRPSYSLPPAPRKSVTEPHAAPISAAPISAAPQAPPSAPPPTAPPAAAAPPTAAPAYTSPPVSVAPPARAPAQPLAKPQDDEGFDEDNAALLKFLLPALMFAGVTFVAILVWVIGTWLRGKPATEDPGAELTVTPPPVVVPADTAPEEGPTVQQEGDGSLQLVPTLADLQGEGLRVQVAQGAAAISDWTTTEQSVSWNCRFSKPGVFEVRLTYESLSEASPGVVRFDLAERSKRVTLRGGKAVMHESFFMVVQRRGRHQATLRAESIAGDKFIRLRSVVLSPRRSGG